MMKFCKKCVCDTERNASGRCKLCQKAYKAAYDSANFEKLKEYTAAYRSANIEKIKATSAAYRSANIENTKARKAAWHKANKDKIKVYSAAYHLANLEKIKAKKAAYRAANPEYKAAWKKANPEYAAAHRAANSEAYRIYWANRRALKRTTGKLSKGLSTKLFVLQRGKCACCGQPLGDDFHLDHVMPLFLGGLNQDSNIQLLTATCNLQKQAKHPIDFMQSRGMLL